MSSTSFSATRAIFRREKASWTAFVIVVFWARGEESIFDSSASRSFAASATSVTARWT